jgi:hemagglutinin/hemolysin-like protein
LKVVGIVKSIVGTDAVIAIDEDGNQRAIFPGDTLYDNEKLLELSGVQVNVEPVTVADAQKKSEPKSDKEVASLQDALLNGKDVSELEETAAGGNAGGGNASSDGVSLGAASFVASGHESSIHADASAISEVAPASVAGVSNVSGGAEEFVSSLETLTVANELLNPQPSTPAVSETPVAVIPATPGEVVTPSTPSVNENPAPAVSEQPANPSQPANPGTWEEPIVVNPSDPHYDHNHHFDDEPTTPSTPTPSTPVLPSTPVDEDDDDEGDEDDNEQPTPPAPSGSEEWFALDGIIDNAVDRVVDSGIRVGSYGETIKYDGGLYKFQGDIEENVHDEAHIIYTNDNTPSLRGSATPGATIKVYNEAGAVIATHTVDDSSIYDIELPILADGVHKFKMEAISPTTGEVFTTKETTPFTVDTNAPTIEWTKTPSTITADGVVYKNGDAQLEFAGRTEPYSDVRIIMVDKSNNNSVDMQVRADENGEFSQKVSEMFPKGTYDVSVQITDPAGNWVAPIKLPVTANEAVHNNPATQTDSDSLVVSPTLALTDITLDSMYADKGVEHLGKHPPLDVNNQMTDFTPTFFGTSEPFANIKVEAYGTAHSWVYSNLDKLVTLYTKADEHGNWQVESDKELGLYKHEVKVSTVDDHGTVLSSLNPVEFWMPERILHDDPYARL